MSHDEMMAFMLSDLDTAEECLAGWSSGSKLLPNLAVIYGIKAKVYMWDEKYDLAAKYARMAIEESGATPMSECEWTNPTSAFSQACDSWMWYVSYSADNMANLCNFTGWISPESDWGYASLTQPMIDRSLYDKISSTDFRKHVFLNPSKYDYYSYQTCRDQEFIEEAPNYMALKFRCIGGDYDPNNNEYGSYEDVTIAIADATYTTEYGASSYSFSIGLTQWLDWEEFGDGTCTWTYSLFWVGDDPGLPIYYRKSAIDDTKAQFRIDNALYGVSITIDYDKATGDLRVPSQDTGFPHPDYGEVYICDVEEYAEGMGVGHYDADQGILALYVIYYVSAGYFGYGYEYVYVDGFSRLDTSVEVAYAGKFIDSSDIPYAVANVTLGTDVEKARVGIVSGSSVTQEALNGIIAGTWKPMVECTASGEVKIDATSLENGKYTLVAVPYAEGEAQNYATATFTWSNTVEEWNLVAVGDYLYGGFFFDGDDPGLELFQSDDNPMRYKIEHWGYDVDFCFTMSSDGSIVVDDQETGYDDPSYGMAMVDDLTDYTGSSNYGYSYYDSSTGTFHFAVIYYVSAGYFGYGYETFTITGYADKAQAKASYSMKAQKGKPSVRSPRLRNDRLPANNKTLTPNVRNKQSFQQHISGKTERSVSKTAKNAVPRPVGCSGRMP